MRHSIVFLAGFVGLSVVTCVLVAQPPGAGKAPEGGGGIPGKAPKQRPRGLVVAHNMNPGMADPGFLKAITTNANLETLFYLEGGGVSVSLKKR